MPSELNFLVVDDNHHDIEKLERAFRSLHICNPVHRAGSGYEAFDILRGRNGKAKLCQPHVILLDWNMPSMNGREFLAELRRDDALKSAVVFVMTTSDHHLDIDAAYEYNVAGYIVKPITREQMLNTVIALNTYWRLCRFPGSSDAS